MQTGPAVSWHRSFPEPGWPHTQALRMCWVTICQVLAAVTGTAGVARWERARSRAEMFPSRAGEPGKDSGGEVGMGSRRGAEGPRAPRTASKGGYAQVASVSAPC